MDLRPSAPLRLLQPFGFGLGEHAVEDGHTDSLDFAMPKGKSVAEVKARRALLGGDAVHFRNNFAFGGADFADGDGFAG